MPVGCASTIVWLEYIEANAPIQKDIAGMMLSAILSDTDNLQSSTTTALDIAVAEVKCRITHQ